MSNNNPTTLKECFSALDEILDIKEKAKILDMQEDDLSKLHHSLGRWMRNNWSLWSGGQLKDYFNKLEINHPDDISSIIITSYWRYLRSEPLNVEAQVEKHLNYWKGLSVNG